MVKLVANFRQPLMLSKKVKILAKRTKQPTKARRSQKPKENGPNKRKKATSKTRRLQKLVSTMKALLRAVICPCWPKSIKTMPTRSSGLPTDKESSTAAEAKR